jgi:branched-chain amino acid transport system substrate-binding protein
LIFLILSFFLVGSAAGGPDTKGGSITIGVLENDAFAFAAMMKGSFNLAKERINSRGGINDRPIELVFASDGGDKKKGVEAVRKLVKVNKAVMLVGGYSSSNTLEMTRVADRLDVPFLVCTAADDRITQRKKKNIFRLNPPASEYTRGLEELLIHAVKPGSMAILYENSPYGTGGAMRMMWFCRENDIEIKAIVPYHRERAGGAYFDRLITSLKKDPPEVVYMVSYLKDGVALVKQIRDAGIDAILCGGAGGFTHPDFIKMAGGAAQHLLTATLWTADQDDILARQYADNYRAAHKQTPDYHGAEAYSALMVAADALRRSKSLKAKDLRDALERTNLNTPFGRVAFQSYGKYERQHSQTTLVLQAVGNRYHCVWPKSVAVSKLIVP